MSEFRFQCLDDDLNFIQYKIVCDHEPSVDEFCETLFNKTEDELIDEGWIFDAIVPYDIITIPVLSIDDMGNKRLIES
jgi:hypothetical protein